MLEFVPIGGTPWARTTLSSESATSECEYMLGQSEWWPQRRYWYEKSEWRKRHNGTLQKSDEAEMAVGKTRDTARNSGEGGNAKVDRNEREGSTVIVLPAPLHS